MTGWLFPDVPPVDIREIGPTGKPTSAAETKRAGLAEAAVQRENLYRRMLAAYQEHGPLTDAEIAYWLNVERTTINARRNELIILGKVQDMKQARRNPATGVVNALWGLV